MSINTFVYEIPEKYKLIVVSDLFEEQYVGGAELTISAILEKCPYLYYKINSKLVTPELIEKNKNKYWLIGNRSQMSRESIITLVIEKINFSIIECDQFYCRFRSKYLHKQNDNVECNCSKTEHGKLVYGFFKAAQHIFFMSDGQRKTFISEFPKMATWPENKLLIQGSTFSGQALERLTNLFKNKNTNNGKWAVQAGASWIKNQKGIEEYCKMNHIQYDLIGGLTPEKFLNKLSEYKGLIAHPLDLDTNPRIVIEACLLGLNIDLNDNVQTKNDEWLKLPPLELIDYLKKQQNYIWSFIKL